VAAPPRYQAFVGIDIAAATFVAVWQDDRRPRSFAQTPDGWAALLDALAAAQLAPSTTLVVLEATGSYWVALAVALHGAGYAVAVINPSVSHKYAKTLPRRSKTDAPDAQLLRQFAQERQREVLRWSPPPAVYHELRQRLVARDALAEMRQQARNQRHAVTQWPVQVASVVAQFDAVEADLDGRIAQLDDEITISLQDGAWAESAALLQSIPGIGPSTAAWLLVATMNFALCATAEAAVAYVGLNPLERQSGTSVRGRPTLGRGGHKRARKALYMASMSAAQHNPNLQPLYARLRAKGKASKLAHCAVARKLVHLAWAVVTKRRPFDPAYGQHICKGPI
jgi:transposase